MISQLSDSSEGSNGENDMILHDENLREKKVFKKLNKKGTPGNLQQNNRGAGVVRCTVTLDTTVNVGIDVGSGRKTNDFDVPNACAGNFPLINSTAVVSEAGLHPLVVATF